MSDVGNRDPVACPISGVWSRESREGCVECLFPLTPRGKREAMNARWIACEHPERPLDLDVGFHSTNRRNEPYCHGCVVAVEAAVARSGNVADDICFGRRVTPGDAAAIIDAYNRLSLARAY